MSDNSNENDGLVLDFLGAANDVLNKYLDEASKTIIKEGLSDLDAAIQATSYGVRS